MLNLSVLIDTADAGIAAKQLRSINTEAFGNAGVRAINNTMDRLVPQAIAKMTDGVNIAPQAALSKMTIERARDVRQPSASLIAKYRDSRGTTLASYGAKLFTTPVNWSNERIAKEGGEFGEWPKWTPRDGDSARNIPAGQKYAGFTASVLRGKTTTFPTPRTYATLIPVRGRLLPVEINKEVPRGKGRLGNAVYGPSVRQLFKYNLAALYLSADKDLRQNFVREVEKELQVIR